MKSVCIVGASGMLGQYMVQHAVEIAPAQVVYLLGR